MRKLKIILIGIVIGAIIAGFLAIMLPYRVSMVLSNSMEPTLMTGEAVILVIKTEVKKHEIIAFFKSLDQKDPELLVKRVMGTEGDHVYTSDGTLYINDEKIGESEVEIDLVVPADCWFVIGDNRKESYDSRYWEDPWVYKSDIVGKVVRKLNGWKEVK